MTQKWGGGVRDQDPPVKSQSYRVPCQYLKSQASKLVEPQSAWQQTPFRAGGLMMTRISVSPSAI